MRYIDFKLNESHLGAAHLFKYGLDSSRVKVFLDKVKTGKPFDLIGGGQFIVDPATYPEVEDRITSGEPGSIIVQNKEGEQISTSKFKKTAEFGGLAGKEGKVANKGEIAEGILGAATMARLLQRPGQDITVEQVYQIIKELPRKKTGGKLTKKAQESDSIVDVVDLVVRLKPATYEDFVNEKKWGIMLPTAKSIVKYVNDNVKQYSTFFEKNGRPDAIEVISDGVSNETGSKTDVYMVYTDEKGQRRLQHFDLSAKTGATRQLGQVGSGGEKSSYKEKFQILNDMFSKFGVDISSIQDQFFRSNSLENSYAKAYKFAVTNIKQQLAGNKQDPEEEFLRRVITGIKFFGTLNDDRVKLVQFTDKGYYVLDFKKLDRLYKNNEIDLDARFIMGSSKTGENLPKIQIFDKITGNDLITIRMFRSSTGYIRNYIEKGDLLIKLTKVREDQLAVVKTPPKLVQAYINQLQNQYGNLQKLTPAQQKQLDNEVDRLAPNQLKQLADANIPWVSDAAKTALTRRGIQ